MCMTGKGILPKKAFLQSHMIAVESFPVLQRAAGFLNWALASLIMAMLLFSSSSMFWLIVLSVCIFISPLTRLNEVNVIFKCYFTHIPLMALIIIDQHFKTFVFIPRFQLRLVLSYEENNVFRGA